MMDFSLRSAELELMDDPEMDASKYREAYLDINRCNNLLGGYGITINAVQKLIEKASLKSYTILDMGCGDGEMLRRLSKHFRKQDVDINLIGMDLRDDVLDIARANSKDFSDIKFIKQDILSLTTDFDCDIILCTLTMHHFTDEQISVFIKKFADLARIGVVINDLERSKLSYLLFKIFCSVFIKTSIARYDGLVSISKGFRKNELVAFSKQIKQIKHRISWKWAFRYVWVMQMNRLN